MPTRPSRTLTVIALFGAAAFAARALSSLIAEPDFGVPGDGWRSLLQLLMAGALLAGVVRTHTSPSWLRRAFIGVGAIHLAMAVWERFDDTQVFGLLKVTSRDHWAHPVIGTFCLGVAALSSSTTGQRRTVAVSRDVAADPGAVFAVVSDPCANHHSPETVSCEWIDGRRGLGARFDGTNRSGEREWTTSCVVTAYESGRRFAYDVVRPTRLSRWTYTVEPTSDGCRVTETWDDLRTPLVRRLSARRSGISDRATHNERTMAATLDRLAAAAETAAVDL